MFHYIVLLWLVQRLTLHFLFECTFIGKVLQLLEARQRKRLGPAMEPAEKQRSNHNKNYRLFAN